MISGKMTSKVQAIAQKRTATKKPWLWESEVVLVHEFFLYRAGENGRKFHTFYDGINFYLNTQQEQQKYISAAIQLLFEEYLLNTDQT